MNRIVQFLSRLPLIGRLVKNFYDGAQWKWGERSWIFGALQDARLDASAMSRKELMRKSRAFERNNAFMNRLADIFEQYTVGEGGLAAVSTSADATDYFKRWSLDCDVLGLMDFGSMQGAASRAWFVDGECFLIRTMIRGRLKIQLVESHRVETPGDLGGEEGKSVVDGVAIDRDGCAIGIWVNVSNPTAYVPVSGVDQFKFVDAEDVIHVFEPSRTAMYRGLPFITCVLNDLNDLDDLQILTAQVAKQAASIGTVNTNRTGELSTRSARQVGMKIQSTNTAGTSVTKSPNEFYSVKLGAQEIALRHGDSISQYQANRPSLAEREHWDYLLSKVCCGVGISKLLVLPISMQGTVARADLDIAAAFFRTRSVVMQSAVRQVFLWVLEWAQDYDREVKRGGFDFSEYENITVRAPRSPNVDVGRNSKALVSELDAGIRNLQDIYAEAGMDWRQQIEQKGIEANLINELAKKYNVDPNDIAARVAAQPTPSTKGASSEQQNDEVPA